MSDVNATVIDAHCHLERETYGDELHSVIARAFDAGLSHIIAVGASNVTAGAVEAIALAESDPRIFATVGIHPHEAQHGSEDAIREIEGYLRHERVVALGEIGLDFYYDNSPREEQGHVFRRMLEIGRDSKVPIMLHVRDAHPEALALLDEVGISERGGVVHCFSAGPDEARAYLDRGLHLSIPGIVTFNRAEELREAVRLTPMDRLLVETDSPYLAPVPHRGRRNEPAFVVQTAQRVAQEKAVPFSEAAKIFSDNTVRLFGLS